MLRNGAMDPGHFMDDRHRFTNAFEPIASLEMDNELSKISIGGVIATGHRKLRGEPWMLAHDFDRRLCPAANTGSAHACK